MDKSDKDQDQQQQQQPQLDRPAKVSLDHARKFLRDDEVRQASTEKKTEFLKAKGLSESDIQTLLSEEQEGSPAATTESASSVPVAKPAATDDKEKDAPDKAQSDEKDKAVETARAAEKEKEKHAPIVTYPEFLAKPARPPPLVTPGGFLNTLYAFAGLSTLVYGASQYIVAPMVASTTDARIELHESALAKLSTFVSKLESVVSEIPPAAAASSPALARKAAAAADDDDAASSKSSCDDPTEVFHRDIGVQTMSRPPSPPHPPTGELSSPTPPLATPTHLQVSNLESLTRSLKTIEEGLLDDDADCGNLNDRLNQFKDDLDHMTYPPTTGMSYSMYGGGIHGMNEPNDGIKKFKDDIRRVKGLMLSARSFPAAVR